jgi:hypothetical protein
MSPAERATQACTDPLGEPYALVPPETPGARCMVAGNPAFYRTGNSPVAARAIDVYMQYNGSDLGNPSFMDQTVYKVFETLDWEALGRLVELD